MPLPARPLAERFWEKVAKGSDDECWPWKGTVDRCGYGKITHAGTEMRATRIALLMDGRAQEPGRMALHRCNVPACVNPRHLYWGTAMQNAIDRENAGHTPRGDTSGKSKLTARDVRNIRWLWQSNKHLSQKDARRFTQSRLGRMYGVTQAAIWYAVVGRTWRS